MIIILKSHPTDEHVRDIETRVRDLGYEPHTIRGVVRTVVAAVGDESQHATLEYLKSLPFVENVLPVQKRYKLISRETHPETNLVRVGPVEFGGAAFPVIAGPCAVEDREQLSAAAAAVREHGGALLRGGAFKPRTSPYDFQGLGEAGLELLRAVREESGLPVVTEVVRESDVAKVADVADMIQVGARNAMNYALLETVADTGKPVILKRGLAQTINEWMLAAEYLVKRGNRNVILCERGVRTFEDGTRNTLDLSAVALAKRECTLPVIVDPSHAAGRTDLIIPLSCAAVAVGADGLLVEVHPHPESALSDPAQQLSPDQFAELMRALAPFKAAAGRL